MRALRAAGHDQAAELVGAIIPASTPASAAPAAEAVPAVAPEIPNATVPAEAVAAAAQAAGPQPPDGKAPLTVADLATISQDEAVARMDEIEYLERQTAGSR